MLAELQRIDLRTCARLNRVSEYDTIRHLFIAVSRAGDGVAWYLLMLALPIADGLEGLRVSMQLALTGMVGGATYAAIKAGTSRPRPYAADAQVRARTRALDRYSFPSGHTLHAVAMSVAAYQHYPDLTWVLAPFVALVALSRPILGLHYPSDVVVGAALGWLVATVIGSAF